MYPARREIKANTFILKVIFPPEKSKWTDAIQPTSNYMAPLILPWRFGIDKKIGDELKLF